MQVILGDLVIADTTRAHRVLETSHPVYYIPREDIAAGALQPSGGLGSFCEWKGAASYLDVIGGDGRRAARAAWTHAKPTPAFAAIADAVAFYPGRMGRAVSRRTNPDLLSDCKFSRWTLQPSPPDRKG